MKKLMGTDSKKDPGFRVKYEAGRLKNQGTAGIPKVLSLKLR
jgi:hypothetical protein